MIRLNFKKDAGFNEFIRIAPPSLTAHELSVRRLQQLLSDLIYYRRIASSSVISKEEKMDYGAHIAYLETLKSIYIDAIYPLYLKQEEITDKIEKDLAGLEKRVLAQDKAVIIDIEKLHQKFIKMLQRKRLLFEITTGRVGGDMIEEES